MPDAETTVEIVTALEDVLIDMQIYLKLIHCNVTDQPWETCQVDLQQRPEPRVSPNIEDISSADDVNQVIVNTTVILNNIAVLDATEQNVLDLRRCRDQLNSTVYYLQEDHHVDDLLSKYPDFVYTLAICIDANQELLEEVSEVILTLIGAGLRVLAIVLISLVSAVALILIIVIILCFCCGLSCSICACACCARRRKQGQIFSEPAMDITISDDYSSKKY